VPLNLNQSNHVAYVKDGSNLRFFVNGSPAGVTNRWTTALDTSGAAIGATVQLGGNNSTQSFFAGRIDELSLYNRALSSNEIASIYGAASTGKCYTNGPAPLFLQHPQGQTVLEGQTTGLSAFAMGGPRPQYQWLFNGTPLPGATNSSLVL